MPPDPRLAPVLDPLVRRLRLGASARALAIGLAAGVAAGLAVLSQPLVTRASVMAVVTMGVAAAVFAGSREARTRRAAAAAAERSHPEFQNLLITAEELDAHPERASAWMRERVVEDTLAREWGLDPSTVAPLARPVAITLAVAAIWIATLLVHPQRVLDRVAAVVGDHAATTVRPGPLRLVVEIEPPSYTGAPARREDEPDRLEVIGGTRLRVRAAGASGIRIRLGSTPLEITAGGEDVVAEAVVTTSTYLAVESGEAGADRLVPVRVTPDRAPAVRIEAPARDLLVAPGAAPLPIAAVAEDDFGLDLLEIRYTKVSGSGEQFEFEEGTLPARVTRGSGRTWSAAAVLPLDALALEPGDSVVYRAVARDARGAEGLASSDTFFVEIQGRAAVLLEGLEMPPEQERYALSQQMVVMKIERLRAREKGMAPEAVREEAGLIAAEQRAVRGNFIFLLGGHVEDEVAEAEHSHEIQEGRLENTARQEISRAIYLMTASETGLTDVNTGQALPPARAAVEALQRAFGRNRYILRTLAVQSRIDPARRLTGKLDDAGAWSRELSSPDERAGAPEARALLAGLLAVSADLASGGTPPPGRLTGLAEDALALAPESGDWQTVAARLVSARDAIAEGKDRGSVLALLREAAQPVVAEVQRQARLPAPPGTSAPGALERAWAAEVRR